MKKNVFLLVVFFSFSVNVFCQPIDIAKYVDPYIGTGDHGHVFLGAHVPFGAVQVGPTNYSKGWDWCSGYHYSDSILIGFSQLHLSGTGIGDLGDILIMPYTGKLKATPGTVQHPLSGFATLYTHEDEVVKPGYYGVNLRTYAVKAEMTASERVGFHKYTFPQSKDSHIAVDLIQGIAGNHATKAYIKKVDAYTYTGFRFSSGWAKDQRVYFAIKLSQPADTMLLFNNEKALSCNQLVAEKVSAVFNFNTSANEVIMLKVGISPICENNALANIQAEIPQWNFDQIAAKAYTTWNTELGKVVVKSSNIHDLRTFYTALYHSFTAPTLFNDHNGDYWGVDKKIHTNAGFQNYSVFSLWDTYRGAHPLYTLVQPERVSNLVKTMLAIYQQQGKLPIWTLMGNETDCMVGYAAVPVIADAIFKGIKGIDPELAFEAMKASSMRDDYGMNYVKERGYIPADKEKESVSKSLEYAVSDWCIAQLALKLGKQSDYTYYSKRAKYYQNYYDAKTGFLRARLDNGSFKTPFNPINSIHGWGDYTEGNAWQYAWLAPQDVEGLIKLYGGDKHFTTKLDSLFVVTGDLGKDASMDISGLIGQYAHGNEPSHHITYLYAYVGEQWKTAEKVNRILKSLYHDKPEGLSGNEDCGQMSAWYILSSIGFYPVNPAGSSFVFGSPLFDEVFISLPKGKIFTVKVKNQGDNNIYIQSATLNGKPYSKSFITYKEIMSGAKLEFVLGNMPNKDFGTNPKDRPMSKVY
jgi:predicted alpha-1,2-mannosidase